MDDDRAVSDTDDLHPHHHQQQLSSSLAHIEDVSSRSSHAAAKRSNPSNHHQQQSSSSSLPASTSSNRSVYTANDSDSLYIRENGVFTSMIAVATSSAYYVARQVFQSSSSHMENHHHTSTESSSSSNGNSSISSSSSNVDAGNEDNARSSSSSVAVVHHSTQKHKRSKEHDGNYTLKDFRKGDEWRFVIVKEGTEMNELNPHWMCIGCKQKFSGSASRIRAHILAIPKKSIRACTAPPEGAEQVLRDKENLSKNRGLDENGEEKATKADIYLQSLLPNTAELTNKIRKRRADESVARFIYAHDLPFKIVSDPYFRNMIDEIVMFHMNSKLKEGVMDMNAISTSSSSSSTERNGHNNNNSDPAQQGNDDDDDDNGERGVSAPTKKTKTRRCPAINPYMFPPRTAIAGELLEAETERLKKFVDNDEVLGNKLKSTKVRLSNDTSHKTIAGGKCKRPRMDDEKIESLTFTSTVLRLMSREE